MLIASFSQTWVLVGTMVFGVALIGFGEMLSVLREIALNTRAAREPEPHTARLGLRVNLLHLAGALVIVGLVLAILSSV